MTETREGHLKWAKERALEYCDRYNFSDAFDLFVLDMRKHPETASHSRLELVLMFYEARSKVTP